MYFTNNETSIKFYPSISFPNKAVFIVVNNTATSYAVQFVPLGASMNSNQITVAAQVARQYGPTIQYFVFGY